MDKPKQPTTQEIEEFLTAYGWKFQKTTVENKKDIIIAPYVLDKKEGVFITFRTEGEFVMVSTVNFMTDILQQDTFKIFALNDNLKLVKIYPVSQNPLCVELGFELWAEAWNKETFFAFMDMLGYAIIHAVKKLNAEEINFTPKYVPLV